MKTVVSKKKASFILAVPTKIGGLIVGILEGIVISLIVIVILSLPVLKLGWVEDSAIRNYLYNLPLSHSCNILSYSSGFVVG